jgi:alanyl-tRNA synthetase
LEKATHFSTFNLLVEKVEVPSADALKQLSYELKDKIDNLIVVLGAVVAGKPQLSVFIAENVVADSGLNAGKIVKELAREIKGGGGGQPFFATAGGSDVSGLDAALEKAKGLF